MGCGPCQALSTWRELGSRTLVTSVTVEEELQPANVMICNGHLYQIAPVSIYLGNDKNLEEHNFVEDNYRHI